MSSYYVRRTGEVVGPNPGTPRNLNNKKRQEFGNLFTSKKKAQRAAEAIRAALAGTPRQRLTQRLVRALSQLRRSQNATADPKRKTNT